MTQTNVSLLIVISIFLIACHQPESSPVTYSRVQTRSKKVFPKTPLTTLTVTHLDDILELERCIKLEVTDQSMIATINDVEYLDNMWFTLDEYQNEVLRFSDSGQFLGKVGRHGQGPGEYQVLGKLTTWKNQLVIADGFHLHFYHSDGTFINSIPILTDGLMMSSDVTFRGNQAIGPLISNHSSIPPYGVIELVSTKKAEPVFGFGKHMDVQFDSRGKVREEIGKHHFSAFAIIGEHIWTSPPLTSNIEIYDLNGSFVNDIKIGLDGHIYEDFRDIKTREDLYRILPEKFVTIKFWHLSPYVIAIAVKKGKTAMTLFDENGNLIKSNVEFHGYRHFIGGITAQDMLISSISLSSQTEAYLSHFSQESISKIYDSGFDPTDVEDDNPYLFISKLKHEPLKGSTY